MAEEPIAPVAIEFIAFCYERRPVGWPLLYDEMCYAAGNRLYKGLGYDELRAAGLDLTLAGMGKVSRVANEVTRQLRRREALAT